MTEDIATRIPFELHLTVDILSERRLADFTACCREHGAKPIIIELARGLCPQQPMLGKVIQASLPDDALTAAKALAAAMATAGFKVIRLKIEIPAQSNLLSCASDKSFPGYYEWHGKVPYQDPTRLLETATHHKAHLSQNAIRGEQHARFVTLRDYGTRSDFMERVGALVTELRGGGWEILKQESEYCIYDSNVSLDAGWLEQ